VHEDALLVHHELPSVPRDFLVLGMEYTLAMQEHVACPGLENQSPLEQLTGKMPDISEFMHFDFYQFVIWYDPNDPAEGGQT